MTASGLINVLISPCEVSDVWDPNSSDPQPITKSFNALWDTGATHSAITQQVVDACGLVPESIQPEAHHAYGIAKNVPAFLVKIKLPTNVEFPGLRVTLGKFPSSDVLIGMDIIGLGDFAVTNRDQKTKFSFRVPSQGGLDFIVQDNQTNQRESLLSKQSSPSQWIRERNRRNRK